MRCEKVKLVPVESRHEETTQEERPGKRKGEGLTRQVQDTSGETGGGQRKEMQESNKSCREKAQHKGRVLPGQAPRDPFAATVFGPVQVTKLDRVSPTGYPHRSSLIGFSLDDSETIRIF